MRQGYVNRTPKKANQPLHKPLQSQKSEEEKNPETINTRDGEVMKAQFYWENLKERDYKYQLVNAV